MVPSCLKKIILYPYVYEIFVNTLYVFKILTMPSGFWKFVGCPHCLEISWMLFYHSLFPSFFCFCLFFFLLLYLCLSRARICLSMPFSSSIFFFLFFFFSLMPLLPLFPLSSLLLLFPFFCFCLFSVYPCFFCLSLLDLFLLVSYSLFLTVFCFCLLPLYPCLVGIVCCSSSAPRRHVQRCRHQFSIVAVHLYLARPGTATSSGRDFDVVFSPVHSGWMSGSRFPLSLSIIVLPSWSSCVLSAIQPTVWPQLFEVSGSLGLCLGRCLASCVCFARPVRLRRF